MENNIDQAQRIARLLDLTSLQGNESQEDIIQLCAQCVGNFGHVAGLCLFPQFLSQARQELKALGSPPIRLVTVANFPHGYLDISRAVQEIHQGLAAGAQEIDLVFPYGSFTAGAQDDVAHFLTTCRKACPVILKIILETGELRDPALIQAASELAIATGADFLKTSTGKSSVHATLTAARIMLETIAQSSRTVGFKASGGIRLVNEAVQYLALAEEILGKDWIGPHTFRFGASSLLQDILKTLDHGK
ncbi:MAG: deoxyribose-phosphate aldolase [Desulfomicrobium sp.]|nr:deoxyribose-phosphate aldolase [Desulfomicrobium sp.]